MKKLGTYAICLGLLGLFGAEAAYADGGNGGRPNRPPTNPGHGGGGGHGGGHNNARCRTFTDGMRLAPYGRDRTRLQCRRGRRMRNVNVRSRRAECRVRRPGNSMAVIRCRNPRNRPARVRISYDCCRRRGHGGHGLETLEF